MNFEKTDHALELMNQTEQAKKAGIEELLAIRADVDGRLKKLGYNGEAKRNPCKVCQSLEHDGRFHKNEKAPLQKSEAKQK